MTKEKTIKVDVLLCNIRIIITDDPNGYVDGKKLRIYCSDKPDEDLTKTCSGFVFQKGLSDYYLMLPPSATCGIIAHESAHVICRMFNDRGQIADYENDEIFAYYVGWLTEVTDKFIRKVYDCFDGKA
jgi:hypothetical protein